jgi:hypothetical protein
MEKLRKRRNEHKEELKKLPGEEAATGGGGIKLY